MGSGPFHDLDSCISRTILLHVPLVEPSYLASSFASQGTYSSTAHGFVELIDLDLALEFHVVSWKPPRPSPKWLSSVATTQPLSVVGAKQQTTHDVFRLLNSY